jgi:hypothetical protein
MLDTDYAEELQSHVAKAATAPDGLQRIHDQTLAMSDGVRQVWDGFGTWRHASRRVVWGAVD